MARLRDVVIDCADPGRMAAFWAAALEGYAIAPYDENELERLARLGIDDPADDPCVLIEPAGEGPRLWCQRVPEKKSVKNRLHLDLVAADPAAEIERLVGLGASKAENQGNPGLVVMADPEGNEFCLLLS